MRIAIINTTNKNPYVALVFDERDSALELGEGRKQSQTLFPTLRRLFQESDTQPDTLDAVAVCTAPGSFTGIRLGVLTAQTIAYAQSIPVIPFTYDDAENYSEQLIFVRDKAARGETIDFSHLRITYPLEI